MITDRLSELKGTDQAAHLGHVAGAQEGRQLAWLEAELLSQGGEMALQVAAAPHVAGHGESGWRSCSSTPRGSRINHLAQQERTAGW